MSLVLNCNGMAVLCSDLKTARDVWVTHRDREDLGASDCKRGCGDVKDERGNFVARVSYNGRVWDADGKEIEIGGGS